MGFDVTAKTRRLTNSQHTFLQSLVDAFLQEVGVTQVLDFMSEQPTGPQTLVVEKE
jgi:hypothetical protein